jgi:hypothetical protein
MDLKEEIRVTPAGGNGGMARFMRLPWRIQKHDPCWVPPIVSEQRDVLDRHRGPFFEIGEAEYFLAYRNGQPAGRISAHLNRLHEQYHDKDTGFFGFFECVPEKRVAAALFDAAAGWLRGRGKKRILGPLSFSIYDEVGLLVDGFDSLPAILQSHNPPYYEDLLTDWGFRKVVDWYALRVARRDIDPAAFEKRLDEIMAGQRLVLTSPKPSEFVLRAEEILEIFNDAWSSNWGHLPLTRKQFDQIFSLLKPLLRSDLISVVLDDKDRIAAFIVNIPDVNPFLQKVDGRLTLWNKLRLFYEAKYTQPRKIRSLILGVRREHQCKRLHHALILNTILLGLKSPMCEVCDCSLISEPLKHFIRTVESFGGKIYKTFRLFEREIDF